MIPPHVESMSLRRPPSPSVYKVVHSFGKDQWDNPFAGLVDVNGELYGTTTTGGASNDGTVYMLTRPEENVLHSFKGGQTVRPHAGLIDVNGTLFGTTTFDGDAPAMEPSSA